MSLLLLAYPQLAKDDLATIQAYRKQHDLQYSVAAPHFTIVFAIDDIPAKPFIAEVKKQSKGIASFPFTVDKAVRYKDDFHLLYHSFLVPEEGLKDVSLLHDKMYSGRFSLHLHPTLAYLPHITIGSAIDEAMCDKIVAKWNKAARPINGTVNALEVVLYENKTLTTIEKIELH